jgi:hypothetical protein
LKKLFRKLRFLFSYLFNRLDFNNTKIGIKTIQKQIKTIRFY